MGSLNILSSAQRGSAPIPSQSAKNKASMAMGNVTKRQAVSYREQDRTTAANRTQNRGTAMRPVPSRSSGAPSRSILRKASAAAGGPNQRQAVAYREQRVQADKKRSSQLMGVGPRAKASGPSGPSQAARNKGSAAMGTPSKKQIISARESAMRSDKKAKYRKRFYRAVS